MNKSNELFITIDKSKIFEYARKSSLSHRLTTAAKAGSSVFENEWNKLCNVPYARELRGKITIQENFDKLDNETKELVLEYVKKDIYDETVDFKCIRCNYEEKNIDYEEIEELWDEGEDYPKLYCPNCDKPYFVPLDVWKTKKK